MNRAQRRAAKPIPSSSRTAVEALFARARASHAAGRLPEAEALYREILAADPAHADAHNLLGVLACQTGRNEAAEVWLGKAIALKPGEPSFHGNLGNAFRNGGKLDQAIAAQRRALALKPDFADAHSNLGNALKDKGELAEALRCYRRAVAIRPDFVDAYVNLSQALRELGEPAQAAAAARRALEIRPASLLARAQLGAALAAMGQAGEALATAREAARLHPESAAAQFDLGNASSDQGLFDEAAEAHGKAIALEPNLFRAHNNLGAALAARGLRAEAIEAYRRALAIKPDYVEAHNNLGRALQEEGRLVEAEAYFREMARLKPDHAEAYFNLGNVANDRGRFDEAIEALGRAIAIEPNFFRAHNNLGVARMAKGLRAAAMDAYRAALAIRPDYAEARNNLGNGLREDGRLTEAEACYREAARLKPDFAEAHSNRATALYELGRLDEAFAAYLTALRLESNGTDAAAILPADPAGESFDPGSIPRLKPMSARVLSNLLMALHYDPRIGNLDLIAAARRFGDLFETLPPPATFSNDRARARLRIGYVSGDFRQHAVGFFLAGVLEAHDKSAFEVFGYSNNPKVDDWTRRLQRASDHWREIAALDDAAAAGLIREDGVDILVDLSGHTGKNRLPMFALRPAPLQVSWLGYFGAIGLPAIDYLLMDRFAVPDDERGWYPEAIVRLPHGRFCYSPPEYAPAPVDPPAARRGFVTFGSFNNVSKIGAGVVRLWADTLLANPDSRLVVKWKTLDDADTRAGLTAAFHERGIDPERLDLRGFSPHAAMLAQYGDVDIALDTFPFGGGLTSCEALWMGVPVVTSPGDRPASRQTAGFLDCIGLNGCVAASPADYVARATALAADPVRLTEIRHSLRGRMAASPLCDAGRFARALEAAFTRMWGRWRSNSSPEGFDVEDPPI